MTQNTNKTPGRGRRSLRFRLLLGINAAIVGTMTVSLLIDYHRESRFHLGETISTLREEAKVLRTARGYLPDPRRFGAYVNDFCRQMEAAASPKHHIIVTDSDRKIITRATHHSAADVEQLMLRALAKPYSVGRYRRDRFLSVALPTDHGGAIVVGQSLATVDRLVRAQVISRLGWLAFLTAILLLVINLALRRWVTGPVRALLGGTDQIRHRQFGTEVHLSEPAEFRELAEGFNRMSRSLKRVEDARQAEMKRARAIVTRILPQELPAATGITVVAEYQPAEEIGGDFYDLFPIDGNRWVLAMADVSGHGVAAALLASMIKTVLHHALQAEPSVTSAMTRLNTHFMPILPDTNFLTVFLAMYNPADGALTYTNAGHERPLILRAATGQLDELSEGGVPIGVLPDAEWPEARAQLDLADRMLLFTDGVVESGRPPALLYGHDRLRSELARSVGLDPVQSLQRIVKDVHDFCGRQPPPDDVSLLLLERTPPSPEASEKKVMAD